MRITILKCEQRDTPNPQFNQISFAAEVALAEDENPDECAQKLTDFVDWHVKKADRDSRLRGYQKKLADPNIPEEQKVKIREWIELYNTRAAEMAKI